MGRAMGVMRLPALAALLLLSGAAFAFPPMLGYTELRTDLPGGRHANVRTMRALVVNADGTDRREVGGELADGPDAWTQFAGWSPDGRRAVVCRGWQDPENARWEEEHKTFRMEPGKWSLDCCLVDLETGAVFNATAVDRVSHYNGGLFFLSDGRMGFTALVDGVSKPFVMDADGRNKRDVSGEGGGFAYGYSASPDGKRISYHEDYQIHVANADGTDKRRVETGNPFNFGPRWSPNGEWILFSSGERGKSNPHVVRHDGTGLRKLADLNGYQGWILFLDVPDFHEGSSDTPVWSADGRSVWYTAWVGESVELFRTTLEGAAEQVTTRPAGTLHYHPTPSPDGRWLAYGSQRNGVRQLFVRDLAAGKETRVTKLAAGHAAMWPHWRPGSTPAAAEPPQRAPTQADVAYGPHGRQVLDFYQAASEGPAPVVMHIHGGGWVNGEKNSVPDLEAYLAVGISVVSINYRYTWQAQLAGVTPPVAWPLEDAARALQYVRNRAVEWNIDKRRIAATGTSAGACSSLYLALHDDLADPDSADPVARESTRLWCAAVDRAQTSLDPAQLLEWTPNSRYGGHAFGFMDPGDLTTRDTRFAEFLSRRGEVLPWIRQYSPYELVSPDDPPLYLSYREAPALGKNQKDPTHTSNYGVKFQERCRGAGVACEFFYPGAPGARHADIAAFLIETLKK